MENSQQPAVAVIGAGIVGVCAASYLQRDGHSVLLIDPGEPGLGASFGNGACLFPSSILPVSMPGTASSVPRFLLDPDGPLSIRLRYLPRLAPWLLRFASAGTPERAEAAARALRALLRDVQDGYAPLAREAGAEDLLRRQGYLIVYETDAAFAADAGGNALRERNGIVIEEVSQTRIREMEPNLAPIYARGRLIREAGHTTNPHRLVQKLCAALVKRGGRIVRETVTGFEHNGSAVTAVRTQAGLHAASHVVLAAGAWSKLLAAQLGDKVPLDTERGYHAMIAHPERAPSIPVMSGEGKFIAIALETGIRFAGQVELASLAAPPNWNRARILLRLGLRMFPGLGVKDLEERQTLWMGHRPSTPDSLPVIGRSSRFANAVYAFGHGHVGMCAAPATGRIVTDLIAGRAPHIAIAAFSPKRFV